MRYALHAEWTKLRSVRSTAWLLFAIIATTVLVSTLAVIGADTAHCPTPAECFEDLTKLSLKGVWLGQAMVVVLAVLAISNEYGNGMIQTTLVANPRRHTVLLTKAAVVSAAVFVAGAVGVLGSLAVGWVVLPANGFTAANGYPPLSLSDGPVLRAVVGTVLYLVLVGVLSLGVATLLRDTAGSITAMVTLLYITPVIITFIADPEWLDRLQELTPMTAGLAIQATRDLDRLPIAPWAGLGVLAAYSVCAGVAACALLSSRDA